MDTSEKVDEMEHVGSIKIFIKKIPHKRREGWQFADHPLDRANLVLIQ